MQTLVPSLTTTVPEGRSPVSHGTVTGSRRKNTPVPLYKGTVVAIDGSGAIELTCLSWSRSYDSHEETGPWPRNAFVPKRSSTSCARRTCLALKAAPSPRSCVGGASPEQTYFRWRKEYGGHKKIDQARRLKDLEQENARLRRALSDSIIDNQILREVSKGNF